MTATTVTPIGGLTPDLDLRGMRRFTTAVSDTFAVMARNLIAYRRVPQLLIFSTIQPVVFVLLFRYVFGGAISTPGVSYVDFLMPGIFAQTVAFGAINTSIGLATDMQAGLIERFRSLPMARSAVLAGRTLADLVRNVFVVALDVRGRVRRRLACAHGNRSADRGGAPRSAVRVRACRGSSPRSASSLPTPRPPRPPPSP